MKEQFLMKGRQLLHSQYMKGRLKWTLTVMQEMLCFRLWEKNYSDILVERIRRCKGAQINFQKGKVTGEMPDQWIIFPYYQQFACEERKVLLCTDIEKPSILSLLHAAS